MSNKGFKINKRGIDRFTRDLGRELQRSADRNIKPIKIDAEPGDASGVPGSIVNNIYGSVNNSGQMAFGIAGPVDQSQWQGDAPVKDPEALRECLTFVGSQMDALGLGVEERAVVEASAEEVAEELSAANPDHGKVRRLVGRVQRLITTAAAAGTLTKLIVDGLGAALG